MLNLLNGLGTYLIDNSILHALDNNRLHEESAMYASSSLLSNAVTGIVQGSIGFPKQVLLNLGLSFLLSSSRKFKTNKFMLFKDIYSANKITIIIAAVAEEILYRGLLQNTIAIFQKMLHQYTSMDLNNSQQFQWILPPSTQILVVNTIFALNHMKNTSNPHHHLPTMIQVLRIALSPRESILHHTTGNIVAPIFSHITNNLIAVLVEG